MRYGGCIENFVVRTCEHGLTGHFLEQAPPYCSREIGCKKKAVFSHLHVKRLVGWVPPQVATKAGYIVTI